MVGFTKDCLTGIGQIDEEHRHLFVLIGQVTEALHREGAPEECPSVDDVLEQLRDYADTHFAHEEAYMERIQDPELAMQKKEHAQFREKIRVADTMEKDTGPGQREVLEDLVRYLTRWLYHHILSSDMMIGKLVPIRKEKEDDPLAFTEKYYTGIELIDREHRKLFDIIASADKLIREELLHDKYDEIVSILGELADYTKEHFGDEEAYMENIQYSRLAQQKRAHEAFVDKLDSINLDAVDGSQQEYLEELMEFLLGWLINHILHADKLIGEEERSRK